MRTWIGLAVATAATPLAVTTLFAVVSLLGNHGFALAGGAAAGAVATFMWSSTLSAR